MELAEDEMDARNGALEEIADMANLSRATVNTILGRFAKQRLIELRYRSIIVTETKSLRKLVNGE